MTLQKRRIVLLLCFLFFLAVAPILFFYVTGYRWGFKLGSYKTGGLYVSSPIIGSKIYLNEKVKKQTNLFQGGIFVQNLKPQNYSVLVVKDGYWPWKKNLPIKEQFVTEARAMLIPRDPNGEIIRLDKVPLEEKNNYENIFLNLKISAAREERPSKNNAGKDGKDKLAEPHVKFAPGEKEKLWWDNKENRLVVEWLGDKDSLPYFFCDDISCRDELVIFSSPYLVRNVDFYPGRKDVVIATTQNGIYAIEVDGRGGRIVHPVYKGKRPFSFLGEKSRDLFIFEPDENTLIKIKLE